MKRSNVRSSLPPPMDTLSQSGPMKALKAFTGNKQRKTSTLPSKMDSLPSSTLTTSKKKRKRGQNEELADELDQFGGGSRIDFCDEDEEEDYGDESGTILILFI